jgi:RNA polymerase sigma-70 factor (ECF subfamily)
MIPFLHGVRDPGDDRMQFHPGRLSHSGLVWYSGDGMLSPGQELIRRMAAGDRDAFAQFYDRYAPLAFALILRIVRDRSDASEVLQDVFWQAWEAAAAYEPGRGTPEAWVTIRARARAIDRVRSRRRRDEVFVAPADEATTADPLPPMNPGERFEDRAVVQSGLAQLSEAQREVIELAYYDGLTQSEIAERTRQPLGTVKTRIRLGLERLREVVKTR